LIDFLDKGIRKHLDVEDLAVKTEVPETQTPEIVVEPSPKRMPTFEDFISTDGNPPKQSLPPGSLPEDFISIDGTLRGPKKRKLLDVNFFRSQGIDDSTIQALMEMQDVLKKGGITEALQTTILWK